MHPQSVLGIEIIESLLGLQQPPKIVGWNTTKSSPLRAIHIGQLDLDTFPLTITIASNDHER